jgi:hypothetical protein
MTGEAKRKTAEHKATEPTIVKGGEPADAGKSCPLDCLSQDDPKAGEKAEKSMQFVFIVAIVTVILIIAAIFGLRYFLPKEKPETVTYNQFTFTKMVGIWYTQWQYKNELYTIPLRFNPYEAENISADGSLNDSFFNSVNETYITIDPGEPGYTGMAYTALAAAELSLNLAQVFGFNLVAACTTNITDACINRTIVTCDDKDKAIIYIKDSNQTQVLFDNNCITVQGSGVELVRAVDRLLYKWYGVIP